MKKQVKHLYRSRFENIDTEITPISTKSYEINYLKDRVDFSMSIWTYTQQFLVYCRLFIFIIYILYVTRYMYLYKSIQSIYLS